MVKFTEPQRVSWTGKVQRISFNKKDREVMAYAFPMCKVCKSTAIVCLLEFLDKNGRSLYSEYRCAEHRANKSLHL